MKKFGTLMVILVFMLSSAAVFAQEEQQETQQTQEQQQQQGGQATTAGPYIALTNLAGQPILDNAGEQYGTIQDAFLTSDGQVSFVIANLQNAPGINPGNYLLPIQDLQVENNQVMLNVPANANYNQVEGSKNAGIVAMDSIRASQIMQYSLVNEQGQNLGQIEDVVLNLQEGTVSYVAVNFSGVLGAGEKLFAVPYGDIWYNLDNETITIYNVNPQVLEQKEGFTRDNWPEAADMNWRQA